MVARGCEVMTVRGVKVMTTGGVAGHDWGDMGFISFSAFLGSCLVILGPSKAILGPS